MNLSMEFPELDDFVRRLTGIPTTALHAAGGSLYREGEDVMTESKEITPVDLGPLRDSGYVALPVVDANEVSVELGFGGAASDYAAEQHENESLQHDDGEAKFLEKPLLRRGHDMGVRISADIAHAIGAQP